MGTDWKEKGFLGVLLLLILGTLWLAVENSITPEEICLNCEHAGTGVHLGHSFYWIRSPQLPNRICPRCRLRYWSSESSIVYVLRQGFGGSR